MSKYKKIAVIDKILIGLILITLLLGQIFGKYFDKYFIVFYSIAVVLIIIKLIALQYLKNNKVELDTQFINKLEKIDKITLLIANCFLIISIIIMWN